jgi:hypothetical protein
MYFLNTKHNQICDFQISSPSLRLFFHCLYNTTERVIFNSDELLSKFSSIDQVFGIISNRTLPNPRS